MAASFPSGSSMDVWPQRRGLQTMNLRSVFTIEQQNILERYYDNGMTNQSKACFQLILQCAQESKLDFSVVRTWVGNKRRKIASRGEQNGGGMPHAFPGALLSNHALVPGGGGAGSLSNHVLASGGGGGASLSNHILAAGGGGGASLSNQGLLTADMCAARSSIQSRVHLLPLSSSFPSFSSSSSSPSSSSLSSGSINNNNDVILTGIYSLNSTPCTSRPRPPLPPTSKSDSEISALRASSSLISQALHGRGDSTSASTNPSIHSKLLTLSQNLQTLNPSSGRLVHTAARKGALTLGEAVAVSAAAGPLSHSWTRQYGMVQTNRPWSSSSSSKSQAQLQPRPHSNPQLEPQPPAVAHQKVRVSLPVQNSASTSEQALRIQRVFTLSERSEGDVLRLQQNPGFSTQRVKESHRLAPRPPIDTSHNFSIAMETGDEEDEWLREEELSNMAAQTHTFQKELQRRPSVSPVGLEVMEGGSPTPPTTSSSRPTTAHRHISDSNNNTSLQGSYAHTAQTSNTGEPNAQPSVGVSAAPWVIIHSRKRTLQDRTQFSDRDLVQLKRYWDRGMTSLGSVCRDKITAAANQLNVDTEIVKTWISNRRRKYRLMGIQIPPPTGGPAVFSSSPGHMSPLSPDGDRLTTPELGEHLNDDGSLCLSEDGTIDSLHRDEDRTDLSTAAPLANTVKVEVIDEDEEEEEDYDYDGPLVASDLDQMQGLLEFKHEEVQFLEHELENQKQKYHELANFTKSLLNAVRTNDLERQQELMASLPQRSDQGWDMERDSPPTGESADTSSNHREPLSTPTCEDSPQVNRNPHNATTDFTESSASEEQLQEAVSDQK